MPLDKRTFYIVVIILLISLPIIVLVFHKSFFPIINSLKESLNGAALMNGATGVPASIMKIFK